MNGERPAQPSARAVALAYQSGDAAPRVVAKGQGLVAQTIIERAREAGVYVHESPELVSLLMQVDLDQRIPSQLYVAVAELLAWLYRLEHGLPTAAQPPSFTQSAAQPPSFAQPAAQAAATTPRAPPADPPQAAVPRARSTTPSR